VVQDLRNGVLFLGVTRLGATSGINVPDSRVLIELSFTKQVQSGASSFTFTRADLFGSETPPVKKPGIAWHGGSLTVR
jgi:hypothetical protein